MGTHRLIREQIIPVPIEDVFPFFADARNLETLTPSWLHFEILTPGQIEMHVGTIIQYALRVHGLPVNWTTAITQWNPPYGFVDTQLSGPYVLWHHRHTFESLGTATRMVDEVQYRLPCGWLGDLIHLAIVRRDLTNIFEYRSQVVRDLFAHRASHCDRECSHAP